MTDPLLSVVTITKDDPPGLARTLASAAALRQAGAEHVVVDGTEPRAPGGVASDLGVETDVRVLHQPPRGIAAAFNAGISAARGEWVWCLNGGDTVDARTTVSFLRELLMNSRAEIIIAGTTYAGEPAPRPHPPSHLRWPPFRPWIPHPSTLVRRRAFERFGLFDERYTIAMDFEWWLRVIPTGVEVDVVSVPLAVFAPGGVSQRAESKPVLWREQADALRRHRRQIDRSSAALWARWVRMRWRALWAPRVKPPRSRDG